MSETEERNESSCCLKDNQDLGCYCQGCQCCKAGETNTEANKSENCKCCGSESKCCDQNCQCGRDCGCPFVKQNYKCK
ncbi:hypothetical protein HHI36_016981 [Cryptolaemus montrouzieri]|uniref:Metallothionein n=1 Tax=Cryptolaemus montrouzieri TaxID=559131 RepID=A0ABD2NL85_9CUCU